jgi:hypothetical protein
MKKEISGKLKLSKILSLLMIILGTTLIIYMIAMEGELGALPLFLILTGIVWFIITQYRIKKLLQ